MKDSDNGFVGDGSSATATLSFEVRDVTGTSVLEANDVQADLPAGSVARSLASRMALPGDVPWALRKDSTAEYLEDNKPIAEQIAPGEKTTLTPKTHLGGGV